MTLLVRTDASAEIGVGHAMRCLALADALQRTTGEPAIFAMHQPPATFAAHDVGLRAISAAPGSSDDLAATIALAEECDARWIIIDGYQFSTAFQRGLSAAKRRVLAFDDHGHAGRYEADIVLNQNVGASESLYEDRAARTRLLLGARYALLRDQFRRPPAVRPATPMTAERLLVTLGGADPDNVSKRIIDALNLVDVALQTTVIAGGTNRHVASLRRAAAVSSQPVTVAVDVHDMAERMLGADLAVASASGTSWELARLGTPQIAITLADNQRPAADALANDRLALSLGWHEDITAEEIAAAITQLARDQRGRAELARRGRALIDGRGALRVLAAMGLIGGDEAWARS
ncbi:MAG: UDP-2,4-diacetamido-2,4,6-trideoxy-beta-L-altropyranose hydrolase [Patulibacter sp.]